MEPYLIAIAARSAERIIAVLLGGLAIYYGFRLFLILPTETQSDGKIRLPGMSVVLAKAGPGLFFLAFGALVILVSLFGKVHVDPRVYAGFAMESKTPVNDVPRAPAAPPQAGAEQEVVRVQLALMSMNCMQRLASEKGKQLGADLDLAAREAKLALLENVWEVKRWGDFASFKQWATGRTRDTTSAAKAMFEAERSDCPR